MLTVSNALLTSRATMMVHSGGLFGLKPVAMVLFMLCGECVTADTSCSATCLEPSRPSNGVPDLPFFRHAAHADLMDGWRCCSQKQVLSRTIHVRQL